MPGVFLKKKIFLLLFISLLPVFVSHAQKKEGIPPQYLLDIMIEPDSGLLSGRAKILNPGDSVFYLTQGMQIKELIADGKPADPGKAVSALPDNSIRISLTSKPRKVEIKYSGKILPGNYPKTTSAVNMVNSSLIELSDQIRWYPCPAAGGFFDYSMTLDIPSDYVAVTNSILSKARIERNRAITTWKTEKPVWNITLVAAPGMNKNEIESNGARIEIYSSRLPPAYIDSMKNDLAGAYRELAELYGSAGAGNLVRLIYSPRPAGGYSRAPVIIVSEKFAAEQRHQAFGYARDLRLNIHEMAHYWSLADAGTSDDWLNEGLAEFSALMLCNKIIGKSFYEILLKEYRGIVANSKIRTSIVETQGNSGEREINRYYKPALLLNDLWQKYGDEKIKQLFSSYSAASAAAGRGTTAIFLDRLEKTLGKETRDSFYEAITMRKWPELYNSDESSDVSIDPVFLGTWSGSLTQFGASFQFVLNIRIIDGKPSPTLDSPDQGAKDIAVTALHVSGDSISFHVPPASGVYRGILDRNKMTITGFWNQRGTDYPLILKMLP